MGQMDGRHTDALCLPLPNN